jgi:hypothetical protein
LLVVAILLSMLMNQPVTVDRWLGWFEPLANTILSLLFVFLSINVVPAEEAV